MKVATKIRIIRGFGLLLLVCGAAWAARSPLRRPPRRRPTAATFSAEQLEQLVAPIALYPDALLTQILHGVDLPARDRPGRPLREANPRLTDDPLDEMQKEPLGPSIKSLCTVPGRAREDERAPRLDPAPRRRRSWRSRRT